MGLIYNERMRVKWNFLWLAMLMALALSAAGGSGINATGTVSPASFFLPGLMKADPATATNAPVAVSASTYQVALAR